MNVAVLHLLSSVGMFGAENALITLVRELKRSSEFTPIVGVFRNSQNPHIELAAQAARHEIESVTIDCDGRFDSRAVLHIRKILNERGVRVLHTHGYKANFYGVLATLFTDCRLVSTCHNWTRADTLLSLYAMVDRFVMRRFDAIATVSTELKEDLESISPARQTIVNINNGISVGDFVSPDSVVDVRAKYGIPPDQRLVTTVGRFSPEKGLTSFLRSAKDFLWRFEDVSVVLVGAGPQREDLVCLATELGVSDRVFFPGLLREVDEIYALVDIFVISSSTEGLPMTLLEAMAFRKPVVATRVGSIPEVLQHGECGSLVDPDEPGELSSAIGELLDKPQLARRHAERGYERVSSEYSSVAMAEKYLSVYRQLVQCDLVRL